ncbi:MauE/DoxX family redox-associated membrane protein [Undibacterium umbellatum]|uniref:Methylamine utilization protein MauE n=1 Tax=Undibacterium umbellatum TaxID=2762300 RepID=A0ABR6ZGV2_9BURK|nr:MauE/DoxX family redox-associated membrane protein [Undibacterium umbellatum]MBC3910899.1 hypothetical protein [Undibacterium umbellatum]
MFNSTLSTIYIFCSAFLSLVMYVSGAAKFVQNASTANEVESKFMEFFYSKYFAAIEIAVAISFLQIAVTWTKIGAALVCIVVLIAGFFIEIKNKKKLCDCFGSLSPTTSSGRIGLRISILFAALYLIIGTTFLHSFDVAIELQHSTHLFVATLALLFTFNLLGKNLQSLKIISEPQKRLVDSKPQKMHQFDKETFLGFHLETSQILAGVAKADMPILIISLSKNCQHCTDLIPDLKQFIQGFGMNLPIVLITDEIEIQLNEISHQCTVLVDQDKTFFKKIGAEASPFGLLLHGTTLSQMAPIAYGADRIRMLFAITLNVR